MRQLHSFVLILGLLIISLMMTACGPKCSFEDPIAISGELAGLVDKSLLTQEPCTPPCWYGITPGITSHDEAHTIIKELDFIDPDSLDLDESAFFWRTVFPMDQSAAAGIIFDSSGIVSRINVHRLWYHLTLQELIDVIGEPDGIITRSQLGFTDISGDCAEISVVWFDYGLEVSANRVPLSKADQPSLLVEPRLLINSAIYFPPVSDLDEFLTLQGTNTIRDDFTMWEGFE